MFELNAGDVEKYCLYFNLLLSYTVFRLMYYVKGDKF